MTNKIARELIETFVENFYGQYSKNNLKDLLEVLATDFQIYFERGNEDADKDFVYSIVTAVKDVLKEKSGVEMKYFIEFEEDTSSGTGIVVDGKEEYVIFLQHIDVFSYAGPKDLADSLSEMYEQGRKKLEKFYKIKLPEVSSKDVLVAFDSLLNLPEKRKKLKL